MTCIISWNIQNGKGVDGIISLQRIAATIRNMGEPDVICLQEVARNLALDQNGEKRDQVAELSALFPGYELVFGIALDAGDGIGERWQYGNATLTRLPIRSVFNHSLPQPANGDVKHMQRQAIELTVQTSAGLLRVVNTHLEFHCEDQRSQQVDRLISLQQQVMQNNRNPARPDPAGPYQAINRPDGCVLCGDFNMEVASPPYRRLRASANTGGPTFYDAWSHLYRDRPHDPTCGIFDEIQWPQGPHCRDFFFVTEHIAKQVSQVMVDTKSDASDHQPLMLMIRDR